MTFQTALLPDLLNHKKTKPKTEPLKPAKAPQPWKSVSCKEPLTGKLEKFQKPEKVSTSQKHLSNMERFLNCGEFSEVWKN